MRHRVGTAVVALAAVVVIACAFRATTARPGGDAEVVEPGDPPGRAVSPHREVAARSHRPWGEPTAEGARESQPPTKPDWATDDLHHVNLVAPHPDELPCGTTDCLLEEPDRHRAETRETLAYNGLTDLMEHQGVPEELRQELRAQLAANLAALEGM